jgi:subtilisin family serine protease
VVWNKKQFLKPEGLVTMKRSTIYALAKIFGEENMKPLDLINGFTVKNAKAPLTISSDEWEVTEEVTYHTFETLYRITPVESQPTPTCPQCPVCPGPNPNPTPQPTPVETAKSWGITRVRALEAKRLVDTSNVKVCVIDTGIDLNHPNNGQIIGSIGYAGAVQDKQGHGTHVAGTIAGTGGVGVSRAKLLVCKGLSDSGSGSSSQLAQCLTWCGSQGAQIVSNSWGSTQSDPLINQAIQSLTQKGIYVFVANGNDGGPVNWPAKLAGSNPLIYAIAASDQADRITSFSSRGPETRFISPGAGIVSNWPGGGTRSLDGTSMATPHAAAICAFGVAKGIKPCIKTSGTVGGYPMADAMATVQ